MFDITKGKSATEIIPSISDIPGKEWVKAVFIDLSQTYRNFVKRFFPKAFIVADRFHVIRLVEHAFIQTSKAIISDIKYQRGILSMLKTNPGNLTPNRKYKLHSFLQETPSLYEFKIRILDLTSKSKTM